MRVLHDLIVGLGYGTAISILELGVIVVMAWGFGVIG